MSDTAVILQLYIIFITIIIVRCARFVNIETIAGTTTVVITTVVDCVGGTQRVVQNRGYNAILWYRRRRLRINIVPRPPSRSVSTWPRVL